MVASEVKSLASQTAKATEEIGAQIAADPGRTSEAVEAIKGITGTIGEVSDDRHLDRLGGRGAGRRHAEIARNVQEAAPGADEVPSNIAGVSQAANQTGEAASQVLGGSRPGLPPGRGPRRRGRPVRRGRAGGVMSLRRSPGPWWGLPILGGFPFLGEPVDRRAFRDVVCLAQEREGYTLGWQQVRCQPGGRRRLFCAVSFPARRGWFEPVLSEPH